MLHKEDHPASSSPASRFLEPHKVNTGGGGGETAFADSAIQSRPSAQNVIARQLGMGGGIKRGRPPISDSPPHPRLWAGRRDNGGPGRKRCAKRAQIPLFEKIEGKKEGRTKKAADLQTRFFPLVTNDPGWTSEDGGRRKKEEKRLIVPKLCGERKDGSCVV